jgi:hypothetical protein
MVMRTVKPAGANCDKARPPRRTRIVKQSPVPRIEKQQQASCCRPAATGQQPAASSQQPEASSQQPAASSQEAGRQQPTASRRATRETGSQVKSPFRKQTAVQLIDYEHRMMNVFARAD